MAFLKKYFKDLHGATAIEYGLIAAGIALAIVAVVFTFGDQLQTLYTSLTPAVSAINAEIETSR